MITPNPVVGTGLHAVGGISASTCYLPYHKTKKWSWGTYWLIQSLFAWIIMPAIIGMITVPGFFEILMEAPADILWGAFALGAFYGFGGMSFGYAIRHIGYSLTYTIAIGLSAVLGTLTPLIVYGGLTEYFSNPGSNIVMAGMILSVIGVGLCGWAGFKKEKDIQALEGKAIKFNMMTGLILAIIAGVLSAVFNLSLEMGQPIADMASANGAGHFEGNAKIIVSTAGCFVVNFIWFLILGIKQKTIHEMSFKTGLGIKELTRNTFWSALSGSLWFFQFLFYGLGHVKMGNFQFISWVLHMTMLIFFSYIIGVIMKEWKNVSRSTYITLICALLVLVISFIVMACGSVLGEEMMNAVKE